jgi:carbohydrate-selective porin OprB
MANFQDAIDRSRATGSAPDISQVRQKNAKVGFGLNIEQAITKDLGLFIRASKHDGKTETYAFTEIDASVSGGMVLKGSAWSRSKDEIGVAFARNAISTSHQQYLRQGGLGVFLGDGNLRYAPERVAELYYAAALLDNLGISYGFQRITNPAYNAVRGPALFHGVRLHAEF